MFKKSLWLIFLAAQLSFAQNMQSLIDKSLEQNYTIQGLEKAIKTAEENIKLSTKWQNPTLTFGVNDVQSGDISRRDLEPMQAQYIGVSQVVPLSSRLDIQEQIAKKDRAITALILEDKKLQLKSKIIELGYSIVVLEKKRELFKTYLHNIEQLKALTTALYENDQTLQTESLNVEVLYHKTLLNIERLDNIIANLYLKLEEITQQKVERLEITLETTQKHLNIDYLSHPKIKIQELKIKRFLDQEALEYEKKIPDVKLNMAYFQRDDKYEDYFNFSLGIPLAIYGSENIKALQAKSKSYEERSQLEDLKTNFQTNIAQIQNELNTSVRALEILQQSIIPTKQKMQEAVEAYNSLQKIKPQAVIQNLNELIGFEFEVLDEQKNYYNNLAQAIYYGYAWSNQ